MNEYLNFPGKELNVPIIQSNNFFKKKQRNQSRRIINLFPSCYAFLKYYIGVSSTNFKIRYGNHKFSFSHEHQKNQTAQSKHYWGLKNKGLTPDIQWSILKRSSTPKSFDSRCNLCLEEKIHILLFPEPKKI